MDAKLKKDIQNHFHGEYFKAAKAEKTGFFKFIDNINDKADKFFAKAGLSAPAIELLASVALFAVAPPAGAVALGAWVVNAGSVIYSALADHAKASQAVDRDIANGKLPERYNDVIDGKITGLKADIEAYTAQKSQLPPKGEASAAFAAAVEGVANENKAPAPTPKPEAAPKL